MRPRAVLLACLLLVASSCDRQDEPLARGPDAACRLDGSPRIVIDRDGLVLRVWTLPWRDVFARAVLPADSAFHAYREVMRDAGVVVPHPALHIPEGLDAAAQNAWDDESANNDLVYRGEVGRIEPITCLDALMFAEQNARVPQLERPTEFLASVLRRGDRGAEEVAVVFGAGQELFPPNTVYGLDVVDELRAQGWRFDYLLHNHTRQADGTLGVPAPSTSDVQFARSLAGVRGLQRIRVTNGFFTFEAGVHELGVLRPR